MKNKILLLICFILLVIYIMSFYKKETHFSLSEPTMVKLKISDSIVDLELEEYIIGVVAAEMPALYEIEALKAQAVASRSYAISRINSNDNDYHLVASIDNQAYNSIEDMQVKWKSDFSDYYEKIKQAVYETKNIVMKNNNEVICAYYFSTSNGYTEDSQTVFGNYLDYIHSVEISLDKRTKNFEKTISLSKDEFCNRLGINCNTIIIEDIKRNNTSHVENITINNQFFKGTEFRKLLGIRSTDFDISVSDYVVITTRGYGHGVGMSQSGANELAKQGYKYQDILHYFYNNIQIEEI